MIPGEDYFLSGSVFDDVIWRQDTAPIRIRVDNRVAPYNTAGIQDGIAANIGMIPHQSAELSQPSIQRFAVDFDLNVARHQFDVGDLGARAEVGAEPENPIAPVIEMRDGGMVKEQSIL